jgi:hypothetical protein
LLEAAQTKHRPHDGRVQQGALGVAVASCRGGLQQNAQRSVVQTIGVVFLATLTYVLTTPFILFVVLIGCYVFESG